MRVKPKHLNISEQPIPPMLRRVVSERRQITLAYGDSIFSLISTRGETLRITQAEYYLIRPGDIFPSWDWAELPLEEVCKSAYAAAKDFEEKHPSIRGRRK